MAHGRVVGLMLLIMGSIAGFLYLDHLYWGASVPNRSGEGGEPAGQVVVAPLLLAQAAGPASGIYRCQVAERTLYQAEPCDDSATESALSGGTVTVVEPYKTPPRPAAKTAPEGRTRARRGSDDAAAAQRKKKAACDQHQRAIDRIDSQARVRSTVRLAEQRRSRKARMWELGCGFP